MEEIEQRAESVLARVPDWIWNGEELPVPVEDIADSCFGLLIREADDMSAAPGAPELQPGQSISGLLLAGPGEIWVNAAEARKWPARRRFTIGHELGHWVLHCDLGRTTKEEVHCRGETLTEEGAVEEDGGKPKLAPASRYPQRELDANQFSAAVLMPKALVESEHAWLDGDVRRLAEAFGVSAIAMEKRLWFLERYLKAGLG